MRSIDIDDYGAAQAIIHEVNNRRDRSVFPNPFQLTGLKISKYGNLKVTVRFGPFKAWVVINPASRSVVITREQQFENWALALLNDLGEQEARIRASASDR